ncbi:hypothetical protein V2J09_007845 [Rumex salicifolius]
MHLRHQLQTLSKGSMSVLGYFEKKRAIADALLECLCPVSDEDFVAYLLYGLGSQYNAFRSTLAIRVEPVSSSDLLLKEEQLWRLLSRRPKTQCQLCKRNGHAALNCFNRLNLNDFPVTNRKAAAQLQRGGKSAHFASSGGPSDIVDPWVIDSGASHHVTSDISNLNLQTNYGGNDKLVVSSRAFYFKCTVCC